MRRGKNDPPVVTGVKKVKTRRLRFKFKPLSLLLLFFIVSILYQLGLGLFGLVVNNYRLVELQKKLVEKNQLIQLLEIEKTRWHTDEFLEKEARKLGLIKEEEPPGAGSEKQEE